MMLKDIDNCAVPIQLPLLRRVEKSGEREKKEGMEEREGRERKGKRANAPP